jgi:hypothetical protein
MTTTKIETLQRALNDANPNEVADCLKRMKLGNMLAPVKATFVGLTSSATQDITTAAAKAAATITGMSLDSGENLPAANDIRTLRVTAGAAAAGPRQMTDAGGTASATVAKISDDGKTLTFEAAVTAFVLTYEPRSSTDLGSNFAPSV